MSEKFAKEVLQYTIDVKYNDDSSLYINHNHKTKSCNDLVSETNTSYDITCSDLKNGNKKIVVECAGSASIENEDDNNHRTENKNTITCIKDPDDNITFTMCNDCNGNVLLSTTEYINNKVLPKSITVNTTDNSSRKVEVKRDNLGRIVAFGDHVTDLNVDSFVNLSFHYKDENDNIGTVMGVVENNTTIRSVLVKNGSRVIRTILYNDCPRIRHIIDYEGEIEKSRIVRISIDKFDDAGNIYSTEESVREYPNTTTYVPNKISNYSYIYSIKNKNARKQHVTSSTLVLEKEVGDPFGTWYNINCIYTNNSTFNLRINVNDDFYLEPYFDHNSILDCLHGIESYVNRTSLDLDDIVINKGGVPYHSITEKYSADSDVKSSISSFVGILGSDINTFYSFLSGEVSYINARSLELSRLIKDMVDNSSYFILESTLQYFALNPTDDGKKYNKTEVIVMRDQNDRICSMVYKDSEDMVANASYEYKDCDDTSITLPTSIILSGQSLKTKTSISQELSVEYDDLNRIVKKEWRRQQTFPLPGLNNNTDTTEESNE